MTIRSPSVQITLPLSVAFALTACGGGGGDANTPPPPPVAAKAALVAPSDGRFPWRVSQATTITLTDEHGQPVDASLVTCTAHDPAAATVAADCSAISASRVGDITIDVSGGGAAATLVVTGVPQRHWAGVHGPASSNGSGDYALVATPDGATLGWGANPSGVLDRNAGGIALPSAAVPAPGLDASGATLANVAQASGGKISAGALLDDGSVLAWGSNDERQLGSDPDGGSSLKPLAVLDLAGRGTLGHIVQAEFGDDNSVALVDDGSVVTWGGYGAAGNYSGSCRCRHRMPPAARCRTSRRCPRARCSRSR